jgi:hypothetical protein
MLAGENGANRRDVTALVAASFIADCICHMKGEKKITGDRFMAARIIFYSGLRATLHIMKSILPQCKLPLHRVWPVLTGCLLEPNHCSTCTILYAGV